jgi:geranylgeranyl pyrophosphate synthase
MSWNYVDRLVRQWIRSQTAVSLGEYMIRAMETALEAHKKGNPSPLVLSIARSLGADKETAEDIAMVGHMFYCAVGLVDDIQDGDSNYLGDASLSQQLNIALGLRELAGIKLHETKGMTAETLRLISNAALETTVKMVRGQNMDLYIRDGAWNIELFEEVARLTAGVEFGLMLYMASLVSDSAYAHSLRTSGESFGVMLQIDHDLASKDKRITSSTVDEVKTLKNRVTNDFNRSIQGLPADVQTILHQAVRKGKPNVKIMESD